MNNKVETQPGDMTYVDTHGTVHISRSIPLPWLIGTITAILAQAGGLWLGQRDNAKSLEELTASNKAIANAVQTSSLSIVKHDIQIDDLRARILAVEKDHRGFNGK